MNSNAVLAVHFTRAVFFILRPLIINEGAEYAFGWILFMYLFLWLFHPWAILARSLLRWSLTLTKNKPQKKQRRIGRIRRDNLYHGSERSKPHPLQCSSYNCVFLFFFQRKDEYTFCQSLNRFN